MSYDEMVEQALCFGWVDSRPAKLDDERSMLWFTPRKRGSAWAGPNKARIERLTAAGLEAVEGARAQWDSFPRSVRRGLLEWIAQAKTATTRGRSIQETADRAGRGERANQWSPKTSRIRTLCSAQTRAV